MAHGIALQSTHDGGWFRKQATRVKDAAQARRLLALGAVADGYSRAEAAKAGGMDRQTLRDWVHRFNEGGVEALINRHAGAPPRKLTPAQELEIIKLLDMAPEPEVHGCVRWRISDLCEYAWREWRVIIRGTAMSSVLKRHGYSLLTARPKGYNSDPKAIEQFKKKSFPRRWQKSGNA